MPKQFFMVTSVFLEVSCKNHLSVCRLSVVHIDWQGKTCVGLDDLPNVAKPWVVFKQPKVFPRYFSF